MLPGLAGVGGFVGRPLSYSYEDFLTGSGATTIWEFSAADFGAEDPSRAVVVAITALGSTSKTVSSVTIGGVSATIIRQQSDSDWTGAIAAAMVPTGATGDVDITLSGNASKVTVAVYRIIGLSSVTPKDSDSVAASSGLTVDTEPQGVLIALYTYSGSFGDTVSWSGASEDYDTFNGESAARMSGASIATTGAATTVTPTPSGSTTRDVFIVATF